LAYFKVAKNQQLRNFFLLKEEGERELLLRFLELTKDAEVVTYNGANFDIPFINQRLLHHGLGQFVPRAHRGFVSHSKA